MNVALPWYDRMWWVEFYKDRKSTTIWTGSWLDSDEFQCTSTPIEEEPHHNIHLISLQWFGPDLLVRVRKAGNYTTEFVMWLSGGFSWAMVRYLMQQIIDGIRWGTFPKNEAAS